MIHTVTETQAKALEKIGISTPEDLLHLTPIGYQDWRTVSGIADARSGDIVTIRAKIENMKPVFGKRKRFVTGTLSDDTGSITVYWFNGLQYLKQLTIGETYYWHGQAREYKERLCFTHPAYEKIDNKNPRVGHLVPVYPSMRGYTSYSIRSLWEKHAHTMQTAIPYSKKISSIFSKNAIPQYASIYEWLYAFHFPESEIDVHEAQLFKTIVEIIARESALREQTESRIASAYSISNAEYEKLINGFPFELTTDQKNAIEEIRSELSATKPMRRLLQGDVGSGKTAVAAAAASIVCANGHDVVFLAPTKILARQHFETIKKLWSNHNHGNIILKTGTEIEEHLTNDSLGTMFIGTTTLIKKQPSEDIGLSIVDEQHRFGVEQRAHIERMSGHFMSLTATPIPRTVALLALGHVRHGVLSEKPGNRKPVITKCITSQSEEYKTWEFCKQKIASGNRIYIVCPAIEQTETEGVEVEYASVKSMYTYAKKNIFPKISVGLLHGSMKKSEQEKAMKEFADGTTSVLFATTMIEVGIDVPEATVMVIMSAERFGLATLHQLRGRVGRSDEQSVCILRPTRPASEIPERLQKLIDTDNGFELAEYDYRQRGAGSIFGTVQSGIVQEFSFPKLMTKENVECAEHMVDLLESAGTKTRVFWTTKLTNRSETHFE